MRDLTYDALKRELQLTEERLQAELSHKIELILDRDKWKKKAENQVAILAAAGGASAGTVSKMLHEKIGALQVECEIWRRHLKELVNRCEWYAGRSLDRELMHFLAVEARGNFYQVAHDQVEMLVHENENSRGNFKNEGQK